MIGEFDVAELVAALDAQYHGRDFSVAAVSTDTRTLVPGALYVALVGERFDGHDFLAVAAERGAVAAVVSRRVEACTLPQLLVDDTQVALGRIARINRRRFNGVLIGVTGSAGKTTCKEMIAAILAASSQDQVTPVLATRGNLNNEIGVPLTLLSIAPEHRFAVIEMGAGQPGDIAYLCRFAEPDIGLVTTALPAHLERMGSVEAIAETKGGLFAGLKGSGVAIVNADSEFVPLWLRQAGSRRVVTFALDAVADVTARDLHSTTEGQHFTLVTAAGEIAVTLPLLGRHNVRNALGAAAAALAAGASLAAVQRGLAQMKAVPGRLQPRRGLHGETVIDDTYNANPGAVKAAIDVLADFGGRRRLVLGNMAELGPDAESLHVEVARHARARGIDELLCVGPFAAAQAMAFGSAAQAFADNDALLAALARLPAVDAVLVKGSRSAGMEVAVRQLCGDDNTDKSGVH
jgi:UDP-N-acetylmuramoyl-tripeptide--D-alanyl-D-alanine ligase